ncbi:type II toxin-antitoxin system Phd/YefM family antitoxin [bacterium]|nr:type II toxin-antitoxin system Phd/YefM family antitoxin [bacterium]
MDRIIGVTELQRKFRAVFDEVARGRIPCILTRGSRPEVVMIPYEQYTEFVRLDETGVKDRFNKVLKKMAEANAAFSEQEVEADLIVGTRQIRKRKRR